MLFANIELRASIQTDGGSAFNLHFLVSPDDPDHLQEMDEVMRRCTYHYLDKDYTCAESDLVKLGRHYRRIDTLEESAALRVGAEQFKINVDQVRELRATHRWFQNNVLIAASAAMDGTGGLRESAFTSMREQLGGMADVIFSGQPGNREYWLANTQEAQKRGRKPKPCLHGSDAHGLSQVLEPSGMRRCWIRGAPTFETLRQALLEPERRVYIGEMPISGPSPADRIVALHIRQAPWVVTTTIVFNDGLVSIIGAKGSGKTALADLLSLGCGCAPDFRSEASFFTKARNLLVDLEVDVEWGDGTVTTGRFQDLQALPPKRATYLSQQFVERLCSRERVSERDEFHTDRRAVSEELEREIQQVIFKSTAVDQRFGCGSFDELAELLLQGPDHRQQSLAQMIIECTAVVASEDKLGKSIPALVSAHAERKRQRESHEAILKTIVVRGDSTNMKKLDIVTTAATALRTAIAVEERKIQQLRDLEAEVRQVAATARQRIVALMPRFPNLLSPDEWSGLHLQTNESAIASLTRAAATATNRSRTLRSQGLPGSVLQDGSRSSDAGGLDALSREEAGLHQALGLDQANAKKRLELDAILATSRAEEEKAAAALLHAQGAPQRKTEAGNDRMQAYRDLAGVVIEQEGILRRLYEPLVAHCQEHPRLRSMGVTVERWVNFENWVGQGEELLDARRAAWPSGRLASEAGNTLLPAWRTGDAAFIHDAMKIFANAHGKSMLESLRDRKTPENLGRWLFSLDHLGASYRITYNGVDLSLLSPGTRGIVLLTLYLAIDHHDTSPLIIDQPEENLDPRSIYDDLRPFFREAAQRRQVIMVTHNANLVVNTDSDQVIVANSQRHDPTLLPAVSYHAGGLEDPTIRTDVCQILEGGIAAFRKRSERYLASGRML